MSCSTCLTRTGRLAAVLAAFACCLALPMAASAATVDLGTAGPFVVLGGASVTNTGPSVLNGDVGVSPGTSLVPGPAIINGATHVNDAVASLAQNDLTTAYDVAAAEAVSPGNVLTGQDLGGLTLTPGAYRFATSAQLTGALTLDAQGDPNAQFVFQIGSTLTTASASSVLLINGASPCNVYWQIGSSATLGTTTAFQGNLMTLASITIDNGATVLGRALAQTGGAVTLNNNVLTAPNCAPPTTTPGTGTAPAGGGSVLGATLLPPGSAAAVPAAVGTVTLRRITTSTVRRTAGAPNCIDGFGAIVRGRQIARVVFSLDGRRIAVRTRAPFQVRIRALAGRHTVTARVTFRDSRRAVTRTLRYRACAAALFSPRPGPARFTG